MAEHENCIGESDEWFTPPEIFQALGIEFDLDPCAPGEGHWVPARSIISPPRDGLSESWEGMVFCNPPFGGRNDHVPWLRKFLAHGNGIAIVRSFTSSAWWHENMPSAEMVCFPKGKTKFVRPDGSIGRAPGHGIALIAMGEVCREALAKSNLGMIWRILSSV